MKIPRKLEQFDGSKALIVVSGKQEALFYSANKGTIEKLAEIGIPRPRYSDHEGEFKVRGRGLTVSSGSPVEFHDYEVIQEFIQECKKRMKEIGEFDEVYIFASEKVKNKIGSCVPSSMKSKVKAVIEGNYFNHRPLELIEKISAANRHEKMPLDPEAQKIMKRPHQRNSM
jgi:hypothetical protein